MYELALLLLKKINDLGYVAYIVGGYPRDKYLNIESFDIDICTNMKPDMLKKYFNVTRDNDYASVIIDNKFEVTTFRRDTYDNSRYPKIEYVNSLEEDLERRDFIINTLCIDYEGNYVDKLGAIKDIENKIIRTVKNSNDSFKEDPLRMVRALRFKIDLNFKLNSDIINSINEFSYLLDTISKTRLEKEIEKSHNKEELVGELNERKSN